MHEKISLDPKVIAAIVCFFIGSYNRTEITEFYQVISKINKIDIAKIKLFINILILFISKNESHISNSALSLGIPRLYLQLILIAKKILDP